MNGHPLAGQLERWCYDHMGRHDDPEYLAYLANFAEAIRVKQAEQSSAHDNGGRFGMSKAGGCTRAATLKLLGHEPEPFSGSTRVTFELGHLTECIALALLRTIGYDIDGTQNQVQIDPFMQSASDGIIRDFEVWQEAASGRIPVPIQAILSVKSTAYKMSSKTKTGFLRRGFTELPVVRVRKAQPSWWAQLQAEMHGSGIQHGLLLAVSKDIVKAYESDPIMQDSGSLTFYAELIEYDPVFCETELLPVWQSAWDAVRDGRAGRPLVFRGDTVKYVALPAPADTASGWSGPNKDAVGSFNYCYGCDLVAACKAALAKEFRGG